MKAATSKTSTKKEVKKDIADSYNQYKIFEGQQYTGMQIGRKHKWYYDKGEWRDHKITPDMWEIEYAVTKRRAGKAPKGSGVPVGTEYHWYILAHQHVKKLDANSYSTVMTGLKYKLAHKRFDKEKWNVSDATQRKKLIKLLNEIIDGLEKGNEKAVVKETTKNKRVAVRKLPAPKKGNTRRTKKPTKARKV